MKQTQYTRLFNGCPGALYGNGPEALDRDYGHIVVDHKLITDAVLFLTRRRVKVAETWVHGPAEVGLRVEL